MNNKCLIDELKKLKESSKEAVENITSFSDFKRYMHVKRYVQDELFRIIEKPLQNMQGNGRIPVIRNTMIFPPLVAIVRISRRNACLPVVA